jgi:hypothetical protein
MRMIECQQSKDTYANADSHALTSNAVNALRPIGTGGSSSKKEKI